MLRTCMRRLPFSSLIRASLSSLISSPQQLHKLRTFFGTPVTQDVLLVHRGQAALHAAFLDWDIQDCEIILPSHLCADVFVPLCIQHGLTPRLVDCAPGTYAPALKDIIAAVTVHTKAIVVVYTYGIPLDVGALRTFCDRKKIILLEDCAHAVAYTSKGRRLGSQGHGAIYSLVKEVPCFGGGTYVNNVRAIHPEVSASVQPSSLSVRDLKLLLHKLCWVPHFSLRNTPRSPLPSARVDPLVLHQLSPFLASLFLTLFKGRKQKEIIRHGVRALQYLGARGITCMSPRAYASGSGKCIAFCVPHKEQTLVRLRAAGFHPGKGWVPSMVSHPLARRWKHKRMPVTERYEQELITLDADELVDEKRYHVFERLF